MKLTTEKLIKKLQNEISKTLKQNTKLLKKGEQDKYDMDDHDDIFYNDGKIDGLETAIELLKKLL
jgi:hypothetical protein